MVSKKLNITICVPKRKFAKYLYRLPSGAVSKLHRVTCDKEIAVLLNCCGSK